MTDPQYSGIVIIIAGYAKDMEKMLSVNEGLKSRFNRFCDFPDWTSEDCSNFIRDKAEKESFLLDEDGAMLLPQGFDNLICCSGKETYFQYWFKMAVIWQLKKRSLVFIL